MRMPDVVAINPPDKRSPGNAPVVPACAVSRLSYSAGGRRLVDAVDLTIASGTRTVIMGPNGAGKSLLLRLLHGLLIPDEGSIRWHNRPLDAEVRQQQSMVFQRPVLLRRSVAANVRFALKLRGRAGNAEIERLLDEVGLADRAAQAARLLSGGEQQRLTLARALATGPKVLFLDEPTASLDPASTAAIEAIVTRAYQRGTKILFVTHDIGQAHRLADDVIFLNHGRVTEHTPAKTFFEAPASQAALDYLDGRLVIR